MHHLIIPTAVLVVAAAMFAIFGSFFGAAVVASVVGLAFVLSGSLVGAWHWKDRQAHPGGMGWVMILTLPMTVFLLVEVSLWILSLSAFPNIASLELFLEGLLAGLLFLLISVIGSHQTRFSATVRLP